MTEVWLQWILLHKSGTFEKKSVGFVLYDPYEPAIYRRYIER